MLENWSLILNVLLLIGVIVAIGRLMNARRQSISPERAEPTLGQVLNSPHDAQPLHDDIIAVRKVNTEVFLSPEPQFDMKSENEPVRLAPKPARPKLVSEVPPTVEIRKRAAAKASSTIMMFLLAKENRQFAGYELLQTVLASGLRFGEGQLFHRHQHANGQGPVLFSLAAATATGVFDLQNIGALNLRGLCLFMEASQNPQIDADRFSVMLDTAKQLSEGLDAYLLDDGRKPLSDERIAQYYSSFDMEQNISA